MSRFDEFLSMLRPVSALAETRLGVIIEGQMFKLTILDEKPKSMPLDAAVLCDFICEYSPTGGCLVVKARNGLDAADKQATAFTVNAYGQDLGQLRWATLTERLNARPEVRDIVDASPAEQARAAAEVLPPVRADEDWIEQPLHDEDCPVCHPHLHPDEQDE